MDGQLFWSAALGGGNTAQWMGRLDAWLQSCVSANTGLHPKTTFPSFLFCQCFLSYQNQSQYRLIAS